MTTSTLAVPCVAETMYIESHLTRHDTIMQHMNEAFALRDSFDSEDSWFTMTELLLYIGQALKRCNGSGYAPPLRLEEFQTQQWRRHGTEPSLCRAAWFDFAWPYAVARPTHLLRPLHPHN